MAGLFERGDRMIFRMDAELMELRDALRERLSVVGDRALYERDAKGHLDRLMAASERLDDAARGLGVDMDPMLRHFLERQSYVKALDWLEARAG